MVRRFWLKRWPLRYRVRGFGIKRRYKMANHFGLTLREWRQFIFARKKRPNPFLKPLRVLPHIDRYGRPPNHPRFQKQKI
jgi:hypothetical protein